MREQPVKDMLKGTVEVDETYIGGKPRYKGISKKGRGTKKIPVLAMVERNGRAISRSIANVTGKTLKTAIRQTIHKESTIMTDEWASYNGIGYDFSGGHSVVNHGRKEYVRGTSTTNTVESYFALMKRGVMGVYHSVSKQHLDRYCDEFSFRWNRRDITDGERTDDAIRNASGKRLVYS
jgi:transposase-like protein